MSLLSNQLSSNNKPQFICENCEGEVSIDDKSCPYCGQVFSSTLCPGCGFVGEGILFENGCPSCGYVIDMGTPPPPSDTLVLDFSSFSAFSEAAVQSDRPDKQPWYSHFSYYILGLAVFVALVSALIFSSL